MEAIEQAMKSWDGAELFYRGWIPHEATDKAILLFHRGHEHSGRWQETVDALALDDVAVFAWDARGHGKSPGERGSADSLATVIKDVDAFIHHIAVHHGIALENMVVLAHSVGALGLAARRGLGAVDAARRRRQRITSHVAAVRAQRDGREKRGGGGRGSGRRLHGLRHLPTRHRTSHDTGLALRHEALQTGRRQEHR